MDFRLDQSTLMSLCNLRKCLSLKMFSGRAELPSPNTSYVISIGYDT